MTNAETKELLARYRGGYAAVTDALKGIEPGELDWKPAPGDWSAREVVHHLADSEMIAAVRLRRILVEGDAQLWPYNPDELGIRLTYQERPLEAALALFRWTRECTAEVLDRMTPADWAKAGMPSRNGDYSTERWLRVYGNHAHEHAAQIRANRAGWRARAQ